MKKVAAVVELTAQELKYLLHGLTKLDAYYNGGARDYNREDMHEKLQGKLERATKGL